jgi:CubicO group peptidase (beta-lactamase class C family)
MREWRPIDRPVEDAVVTTSHRLSIPLSALMLPLVLLTAPALADIEGHWEGAVELPGQRLEIRINFARDGEAWTGDISIPAQGARNVPLQGIALEGPEATFAIAGIPGDPTFSGALDEGGDTLSGDFTQAGQTFPFLLTRGDDHAAGAAAALADLPTIIESALEDWKTPGLGLAVVVDGKVVLAEGYGVRDVEGGLPVTSRTLFAIGSASKAFTTFVLGLLVDEGRLEWDEPVASYLPGFRLYDEYATAHLTPRDMVTHRSGLPRHDLSWYNNETISRADLVHRLRYLPPNKELRETWQYNNLMFLTAGHLVEQLTGSTWEEAVREKIFTPLGMARSNFSVEDSKDDDDAARPYIEKDDEVIEVAYRPLNVMGPAGSINSSVEEMAAWLRVHLGGGTPDGAQLMQPGTLKEMHTPQMIIPGLPDEPEDSPASYALGWFVDTWRGHFHVHHGGNIDGFSALVTLYPNDGLGVVALVNRGGSPLPGLLTRTVADRVLGLEPRDWIGEAAVERDEAKAFTEEARDKKEMFRLLDTRPAHDLATYAGDYEHPGYGTLQIAVEEGALVMTYNAMRMPLEHWHYDTFNVAESEKEIIPEDMRVTFLTDTRGRVSELTVPFEPRTEAILFHRLPSRRLSDPTFLSRLTGSYRLPGATATVSLKGEVLVVQVAGQPALELQPAGEDEFTIKTLTGFGVRFTLPAEGPATEVIFIQPNGVFTASRVAED